MVNIFKSNISQISFNHRFISLDFLRSSFTDFDPMIENSDTVGYAHNHIHIMFYE